jgi:hypothetical protein
VILLNILLACVTVFFGLTFLVMIAGRIVQPHNPVWSRIPIAFPITGALLSGLLILITILSVVFPTWAEYLIGSKVILFILLPMPLLFPLSLHFLRADAKTRFVNRSTYAIAAAFVSALFFLFAVIVGALLEHSALRIENVLALLFFVPIFAGLCGVAVFVGLGSSAKMQNTLEDQLRKITKDDKLKK